MSHHERTQTEFPFLGGRVYLLKKILKVVLIHFLLKITWDGLSASSYGSCLFF